MEKNDKNSPSYKCAAHLSMAAGCTLVDDVLAGTSHLRAQGKTYLPQHALEEDGTYQLRLKRATLFNAYEKARNGLIGLIFHKPPQLGEDVPLAIRGSESEENRVEGHAENIDLMGTHWTVFTRDATKAALHKGHSAILVDMPPALKEGASLAEEREAGRRPYWVLYQNDQILNWRTMTVNGKVELAQITFEECSTEADGEFGEKEVTRYRVFRKTEASVQWQLYRLIKEGTEETVELEDEGPVSLDEISVAVIYGNERTGYLTSQPSLGDLAHLNIKHYQKSSEYDYSLYIANNPLLWARGRRVDYDSAGNPKPMAIGPDVIIDVGDNGMLAYAEPTGASIGAARQDLEDIKKEMAILGLSMVAQRTEVDMTATEALLNSAEESSPLGTLADSAKDAIERCLGWHAAYLKLGSGGSVTFNPAFKRLTLAPDKLRLFMEMVEKRQLSLETMLVVLQNRGDMPDEFNPAKEIETINKETQMRQDPLVKLQIERAELGLERDRADMDGGMMNRIEKAAAGNGAGVS